MPAPDAPLPDLPDLMNLRDVGGFVTDSGGRVRRGVLYRSATPYFLDPAQASLLVERLGIRLRIDLRSRVEVAEATNPDLAAVERQVLHLPFRAGGTAWHVADHASVGERVAAHYLRYLDHSTESVVSMVRALAAPDAHPALLHCTAGKDRTGVAVALVLSAVGVPDEEVVADYARTHDHIEPLFAQLHRLPAYEERIAALPEEARTAEPESMSLFLEALEDRHGGAVGYLHAHGAEPEVLERLREVLVEPEASPETTPS